MSDFVSNRQISCTFCRQGGVRGRESDRKLPNGKIIHECRWVCSRCGNVVRKDQKEVTNQ